MRAVGYTLEAAVADLLDNSLSAGARSIRLRFSPYGEPYVAIIDDGHGMDRAELVAAMRHGSRNPRDVRAPADLGRFGLGLKTASLSQCRQLTVVSLKKGGQVCAARWDLDVITRTEQWTLQLFDREDIATLPFIDDLKGLGAGTVVLWRNLDRLAAGEHSIEQGLGEGMVRVRNHLSLVFHRFLDEPKRDTQVSLSINEDEVRPLDPFLRWHRATHPLPEDRIRVDGQTVVVRPYILPHYSKLKPADLDLAGGEEGLRRQQGFYVYRGKRLIIWGTWFRLARQEELTKLARVQVDIPNSLDHLWTLDIKKSIAHPPVEVRTNLRRILDRISESSRRVYVFRGRRRNADQSIHVWDRIEGRDGTVTYKVNRDHPLVQALLQKMDEGDETLAQLMLSSLEKTFPVDALYADMASERRALRRDEAEEEDLADLAARLIDACGPDKQKRDLLLGNLHNLEPFLLHLDVTRQIVARLRDGK